MAELVTENAEGSWRITEAPCDFGRGDTFDEVGAECFILALPRGFGGEEELGSLRRS